ncbi:MAG TPA: ribosome small subunit-dependent GTPase A [Planctomycetaceae bacterium]|nr:ribosome small subunit-dependent GTPase A [Planctomycetaceae bacterium]
MAKKQSRAKRKLRVAFKKNRERRARQTDLTRELRGQPDALDDRAADERVSGKGALTRYRTVRGETGAGGELVRDVDESKCLAGRVIAAAGLTSLVETGDGRRFECTVRGVVRELTRDARNAVVTGDRVLFQPAAGSGGVIERVNPRYGVIARQQHGREHILVSNVDQVLIVASLADPPLKPGLIDRLLISAEKGGVRAIVCLNKCDLVDPAAVQPLAGALARLGYDVVLTSAADGRGLVRLRCLLAGHETVIAGQSGVGKSSLLNALEPKLNLQTDVVSGWTRKGRHTTRRAVLYRLGFGGWIADTPGVRQFELWDVQRDEVEGYFREFRPFVPLCKFADCLHLHEEGCGVQRAASLGLISPRRYESFVRIVTGEPA